MYQKKDYYRVLKRIVPLDLLFVERPSWPYIPIGILGINQQILTIQG